LLVRQERLLLAKFSILTVFPVSAHATNSHDDHSFEPFGPPPETIAPRASFYLWVAEIPDHQTAGISESPSIFDDLNHPTV